MSKRIPIIVIGFIVLVLLAVPFAIGKMTESALSDQVGVYTQNPALATNVQSYERSWFNSRVELGIRLSESYLAQLSLIGDDPMAQMFRDFSIPVIVDISHGPVLFNDGMSLGFAGVRAYVDPQSQVSALATQFLGVPYVFEFRGRAGFGTGLHFEGEIPAFENATGETGYAFSGFEFSGVMQQGDTRLSALLESASFQSPLESILLEDLAIEIDTDYREGMFPLSDAAFSVGRVTASNPLLGAQPVFSLGDAAVGATVTENEAGTHVDMKVFYRLANLEVPGFFAITDVDLTFDLNHLETAAATRLYELYMEQLRLSPLEQDVTTLAAPLEALMAGEPTLSVDPLRFSMSGGAFAGTANLALDMDVLPTGRLFDLSDPFVAQQSLVMDLDLRASKNLVEYLGGLVMEQQFAFMPGPDGQPMTPEQIQAMASAQLNLTLTGLVAQGILLDESESFTTSIVVRNGETTANGQPIPLGAF